MNATLNLFAPEQAVRTFEEWRQAARPLLAADGADMRVPRSLIQLLEAVSCYRDPGRWQLMYRLAARALSGNPRLLEDHADPDVRNAQRMARAVDRECHKMHAFIRFREVVSDGGTKSYFAWFEPEHEILRRTVPFFTQRFRNMDWTIATPDGTAVWKRGALEFIDAPLTGERPDEDALEPLWRTYYRSICNVSRISTSAMQREMPRRYWRNLPETVEIGRLVRGGVEDFARQHAEKDVNALSMARAVQSALAKLPALDEGPSACRRCSLWRNATQAVSGEGPETARIMLVGEQPGDEEDVRGRPFVGPAGKVLDEAIASAGLERKALFVTNAVRHFKWEPRGKRRLHRRPDAQEISACKVWLQREIETLGPAVIVALGATALRALTGSSASIESCRGAALSHSCGARIICTYHPSSILRAEPTIAARLRTHLIEDLRRAASMGGH